MVIIFNRSSNRDSLVNRDKECVICDVIKIPLKGRLRGELGKETP